MYHHHRLAVLGSVGWWVGAVGPAWVWWQVVVVELRHLGAVKRAEDGTELLREQLRGRSHQGVGVEDIWQTLLDVLVDEASEVVALEEVGCVVDAAGEVSDVNASVGVDTGTKSASVPHVDRGIVNTHPPVLPPKRKLSGYAANSEIKSPKTPVVAV